MGLVHRAITLFTRNVSLANLVDVYSLAVAWITGKQALWKHRQEITPEPSFNAPTRNNPYYLPWIMAKLIGDQNIASHSVLSKDLKELQTLFETWEPSSSNKALKDLKYRLEPLKNKL
jgi:hypothetical protein